MVDYIHNDLFLKDSTITNILVNDEESGVTFGNEKIYFEELELDESISFLPDLNFGSCTSNGITLKVRSDVGNLKGKKITVSLVLNDNTDEPFTLGTYKVISDNLQANEGSRVIEAYDDLYEVINTDVAEWYNNQYEISNARTVAELRHSLLQYFGIQEEQTTLVNDSVIVEKTINPTQLSGYDVLSNICELNGVFAHIGRDNVLRYLKLSSNSVATITVDKYVWADYESFKTSKIDAIQIRQEENDIGGAYPQNIEPTNGLVIEDNFLVYGKKTNELNTIAQRIFGVVKNIEYCPIEMLAKGDPALEVGDCVKIQTTDGSYITTYVLERRLEGIQTMADKIEAKGNEERDNNINTVQSKFMQLKGQTATLEHTVDGLRSTVTTIEGNYTSKSELQQTSDALTAQINQLQSEIDGSVYIYYTDETPTLLNYPAWDFTYNIPCNDTVRLRNDLKFLYTEEYYRRNLRSLAYDETAQKSYRFLFDGGVYGWVEVEEGDIGAIIQRVSSLEMSVDGITANVAEIEEDLGLNYATKSEVSSSIEQTASSITSSVSSTYQTIEDTTAIKNSLQGQINTNSTAVNNIQQNYATKTELNSSISQTTESITSSVSATYETKNSANTTKSNLQGQIDTNKTNITNLSNNVSNNYATKTAMNSAISQSASSIEASVSATYVTKTDASTERNRVNGQLALKVAKDDNDQVVSMLNASADVISIKGNRFEVESDNFSVSKDGYVKATGELRSSYEDGWYSEIDGNGIHSVKGTTRGMSLWATTTQQAQLYGLNGFQLVRGNNVVINDTSDGLIFNDKSVFNEKSEFNDKSVFYNEVVIWNSGYVFDVKSQARFEGWTDIESQLRFGASNDNNKVWVTGGNNDLWIGNLDHINSLNVTGKLQVYGAKNRVVYTENYGTRAMNAYETAYAQFGDNGCGTCDENGLCEIEFEPIFAETIDLSKPYQVFLTQTSEKVTKWVEKKDDRFIIHGEPGATFDYMIVARQKGYADIRLESVDIPTIND